MTFDPADDRWPGYVPCPRVCTYFSDDVPSGDIQWAAKLIPADGKPLPIVFFGRTESGVQHNARRWWHDQQLKVRSSNEAKALRAEAARLRAQRKNQKA